MTALVGQEVEVTFSMVHGRSGGLFGSAAAQPHQAAGQDGTDLPEVRCEMRTQC
jgi:hypothetical protein